MNISLDKKDAAYGIIKMEVVKEDYAAQLEKSLKTLRQRANLPGFRKGMVPMGMIKKMYGKSAMIEEVNKTVSEKLFHYIQENKLNILGEPIPNQTEQKEINFDTQDSFEFCFDVAFAPEINVELGKGDKLPYYKVQISDDMVTKQLDSYRANFGSYDSVDEVEDTDLIKGTVAELENGVVKEGGIVVEDGLLMPSYIKNDDEKKKFIGAKKNEVVIFNPFKAYEGAEAEISSFLKIDKSKVAETTADFSFEIKEITRHKSAELNQELFDKVFGEGLVTTEEEFRNKIVEALSEQYLPQCDYKFIEDARDLLVSKAGELTFADDVLKRWMLISNDKNTPEKVDADYPKIIQDLTFHLIKEQLVKANGIKIENSDIEGFAKRVAKAQFAQYGMLSVPEDVLDNYAKDMLKNEQTRQNILDRSIEEKLAAWMKSVVELDEKEVTPEEFNKLFE